MTSETAATTAQMGTPTTESSSRASLIMAQTGLMNRVNLMYGALGVFFLAQAGAPGSWRSFAAGWLLAVLNLELLRRLGAMLVASYDGSRLGALFYFVLFGKFAFWGLVIALFTSAKWILAVPFVAGMATLVVGAGAVGLKEMKNNG